MQVVYERTFLYGFPSGDWTVSFYQKRPMCEAFVCNSQSLPAASLHVYPDTPDTD